jgi:hypothetical protein
VHHWRTTIPPFHIIDMPSIRGRLRILAAIPALVLPGLSCGIDVIDDFGPLSRVYLTDAPFPYNWIARVDMYIVSVAVSVSPDTGVAANFVTVASPNRRINLLALSNGLTEEIGVAQLPPGPITAVRVTIDTDSSSMTTVNGFVITDKTFSPSIQWQSSAGRPVLNALIHEQITVPDSGARIVIDYDVGKAFILNRELDPGSLDSGFVFSPVIRAADANRTGSIRGNVRALSATGAPQFRCAVRLYRGNPAMAENTWSLLATAGTNEQGDFLFSFVTRSAYWESLASMAGTTYIVVAEPHPGGTITSTQVSNVTVTAGVQTDVGTLVLPAR